MAVPLKVILEQWDALLLYFQTEASIDKVDGAAKIYQHMRNVGTKHMLLFLHYILQKVTQLNIEFQSEHFRLHVLHERVTAGYKEIMSCFIKDDLLADLNLHEIDPSDRLNQKPLDSLFLGGRTMAYIVQVLLGDA